ncbi:MAG: BatD family protein [Kiritimatiellae bacterium]|nr:BatD family protein [Kiritimatiellia bacterium]
MPMISKHLRGWAAAICAAAWMLSSGETVAADRPAVEARIEPSVTSRNEPATLSLIFRSNRDASPPDIRVDGLRIDYRGSSTQMSYINGVMDQTKIHQYTVWADRAGSFEIGPFSYEINGRPIEIPGVLLRVADSGGGGGTAILNESLRAELKIARPRLYVMEDFVIELAIYSNGVDLAPNVQLMGWPESGFRVAEWREMAGGREIVSGAVWQVRRFSALARAEYPGKMTISPSVRVEIPAPSAGRRRSDPFSIFGEDFFAGTPFDRTPRRPHDIAVPPLDLEILPLPQEGRPASFAGAVGEAFHFRAEVTPSEVEAGSPLTLRMSLAGRSSLEGIRPPSVPESEGFRVYEPRSISTGSAQDRRYFEQVVIPRTEHDSTVPEIEFSYFNPVRERYETIRQGPFPVRVKPSTGSAVAMAPDSGAAVVAPTPKGDDLLYLKLSERAPSLATRWARQSATKRAVAYAIPVAGALMGWGIRWGVARRRKDPESSRSRRARGAARTGLLHAHEAARAGDSVRFHDAVAGALSGYILHRMGLSPGAITGEGLFRELETMHLDPDVLQRLGRLWKECETARFGGAEAGTEDFEIRLKEAEHLLKALQRAKIRKISGGRP